MLDDAEGLALPLSIRKEIGKRLRAELRRRKVKQTEVATLTMVSKQAVNHWLQGRNLPELAQLYRIAERHNLSTDYILFGRLEPDVLALAQRIAAMPATARTTMAELFSASLALSE